MIKMIHGIYGYRNANGIIIPKTENSEPFELTAEQEERLVKRGVAVFVEENRKVAPVQPTLEEQLSGMGAKELKKLAKEKGVEPGTKEEMIAGILEAEQEEEAEEDEPNFSAQLPS